MRKISVFLFFLCYISHIHPTIEGVFPMENLDKIKAKTYRQYMHKWRKAWCSISGEFDEKRYNEWCEKNLEGNDDHT